MHLVGAGLTVLPRVTKKLDLLVMDEPDSMSGKAKQAREYGVRLIAETAFWEIIGVEVRRPVPRSSASAIMRQPIRQQIEVPLTPPRLQVADHIQPPPRPADRDVQQVRLARRPGPGSLAGGF